MSNIIIIDTEKLQKFSENFSYYDMKIAQLNENKINVNSMDLLTLATYAWRINGNRYIRLYNNKNISNRNIMIQVYCDNNMKDIITNEDKTLAHNIKILFSQQLFNQIANTITKRHKKCLRAVSLNNLTWSDASFVATMPGYYNQHIKQLELHNFELSFINISNYVESYKFELFIYNIRPIKSKKIWLVSCLHNSKNIVKFFIDYNLISLYYPGYYNITENNMYDLNIDDTDINLIITVSCEINKKERNCNTNVKETMLITPKLLKILKSVIN